MSRQRAKGTAAETAWVKFLNTLGFAAAERRALHGTNDKGDVAGIPGVVHEVKNCATLTLAEWVKEAQAEAVNANAEHWAVIAKRRGKGKPGDWYVVMDGNQYAALLLAVYGPFGHAKREMSMPTPACRECGDTGAIPVRSKDDHDRHRPCPECAEDVA